MVMKTQSLRMALLGAALSVAGVGIVAAAPARAQSTVDELTVTGRYGPGNEPNALSQAVSYADLDLSTGYGRDILRRRVSMTAHYLCRELGEDEYGDGLAPSCQEAAVRDAMYRARPIIIAYERRAEWAWREPYRSYPYYSPYPY
jgi:UrcA family protein